MFPPSGKRGKGKMSTVLNSLDETNLPPACACGGISSRKSLMLHAEFLNLSFCNIRKQNQQFCCIQC
jgi:hypothetical protein